MQDFAASVGWQCPLGEQIETDRIIITCVQSNLPRAPGFGHRPDNIQRLITIKRRNLDGDDVNYLDKMSPEGQGKDATADRGLQIKADQRDFVGNGSAMGNQVFFSR